MRRRPTNSNQPAPSNKVFSSDAWATTSSLQAREEVPTNSVTQYAASLIPEGGSAARVGRHSPQAHSSSYLDAPVETNSSSNPFSHSSYDGRPLPQQRFVQPEEISNPLRKAKLGFLTQTSYSEPVSAPTPEVPAVAPIAAPMNYSAFGAPAPAPAPIEHAPDVVVPTQPHIAPISTYSQPAPVEQSQPAYEHVTGSYMQPSPEAIVTPEEEEDINVSDFEKEFNETVVSTHADVQEDVVDITQAPPLVGNSHPAWSAPQLFSSAPVPVPAAETAFSYGNDDFFANAHPAISDEDAFYYDDRGRETVIVDMAFVKRHARNLIKNKLAVIVMSLILIVMAFLAFQSITSTDKPAQDPSNTSKSVQDQVNDINSGKTVVTSPQDNAQNNASQPQVTVPATTAPAPATNPAQDSGSPSVYYDAEGNLVYSGPTNQNFNG